MQTFLCDNGLLVILGGQLLDHSATFTIITAPSIECLPVPLAVIKRLQVNSIYGKLLTTKPKVTELNFQKDKVLHGVELSIDTGQSPPLLLPAQNLPHKLTVDKGAFKGMEDL